MNPYLRTKNFAVAGVCSCNHLDTQRNSYGESKLEFSWSQEQTPATANTCAITKAQFLFQAF